MRHHEFITEGIHDPHIFKAVFTIGGPGSGKTTVSKKLLAHTGLKRVDIDNFYNLMMSKEPVAGGYEEELYKKAGVLGDKQLMNFLKGRLGMVIDGTGREVNRLEETKKMLESNGYDTMAIFVNVDLKTAIERNLSRPRLVPVDHLKKAHTEVRNNLGEIQRLFGNKLLIIDNSIHIENLDLEYYSKQIDQFLRKPITSKKAVQWINSKSS